MQLAPERPLVADVQVLHELLRQRAAALHRAPRPHVAEQRAAEAHPVHAVVLVEALVLGRQHGVDHGLRDPRERDQPAVLSRAAVQHGEQLGVEEERGERLPVGPRDALDEAGAIELDARDALGLEAVRIPEAAAADLPAPRAEPVLADAGGALATERYPAARRCVAATRSETRAPGTSTSGRA